jgi:hypothetical protein
MESSLRQQAGYILTTWAGTDRIAAIKPYELEIAQAAMRNHPADEFLIAILNRLVRTAPPSAPPAQHRAPSLAAAGPLPHGSMTQSEQGHQHQRPLNMHRQIGELSHHREVGVLERPQQERGMFLQGMPQQLQHQLPQQPPQQPPQLDRASLERLGGGWGTRREDSFPMSLGALGELSLPST